MNHITLSLMDPQSPLVTMRCRSYAGFAGRLAGIKGRTSTAIDGSADAASALTGLAAASALTCKGEPPLTGEIQYVPTRAARERVGAEEDGMWPQSVAARQRKAIRRTTGALFTFPLENPEHSDPTLEVFTTDWSPSPAACAIAVYPGHPLSSGLPAGRSFAFTGRYCRHPLTGDLLPIWTAAWVKPEFGTGAVLVNPGHDGADLAFGREVGLPVRFALAPASHDGSPETWLTPPVVKAGTAIRTGATDGLDVPAAQAEYFRILASRELACEYTDFGAGSFAVATFTAEGAEKIHWDQERRTVVSAGQQDGGSLVQVNPRAILAALDPMTRQAELSVVGPSSAIESDLLALRLLLAEPESGPMPERAPDVVLVGQVTGKSDGVEQDVLELTMLTAAAAQETLSIKPQQLETAQRFLDVHAALAELGQVPDGDAEAATAKAAGQVKNLLQRGDTKQAFTHLYRLQKTLAKGDTPVEGALVAYEALAWVVAGLNSRYSPDQLGAAWERI
ncbi:class I tRNA ligase family protein [Streptomyces sp. WMMB 322]|uniref:class I tRNA ligase family protein n=1 Tax=Streptomyces sp. WMMB 322 TaxID=1286821 RepID=UPI0006E31A31|nr:class I tRNA ligase family protein [Streptomyces sp. WMMB 322]SCK09883.1 Leucyl-tRNA synthetase, Domain 2 [Streptomyces sp. WMMB 322]